MEYSNSGYVVLSKIIETVSGQSYSEYLQQNIFAPLEMNDSGYDQHELILSNRASGYSLLGENYLNTEFIDMTLPSGAGSLYSTIEDLYKWDRGLYGDKILKESSKKSLFAPSVKINSLGAEREVYMCYGWVLDVHYQHQRVAHNGGINGFSTHISRYLNEQAVIIVLSNLEIAPATGIANDLAAILFGQPYEIPEKRQAIELDPVIYQRYVGTYQLLPEVALTIKTEDKGIFAQLTGQEFLQIFPQSQTKFFYKAVDAQLTFITEEAELASKVILHQNGFEQIASRI